MANRVEDVCLNDSGGPGRMIWSKHCQVISRPCWFKEKGSAYLTLFVMDDSGKLFKWDKKSPVSESWSYHFRDGSIDPDGHLAFCAGAMPPHVYADWLEERLSDVPAELLALLRERMGDGN